MQSADIRINARLTGEDAARFQTLLKQSGYSASQLLRVALRDYHQRQSSAPPDPRELLSGFVGAGIGAEDLSQNYKTYLSASLTDKFREGTHGDIAAGTQVHDSD